MKNKITLIEFVTLICHSNDKLLVEIMDRLNHIDDMSVVTYMKAYFISRIHQNCLKLKKGHFFYKKLYKAYKISFMEDVSSSFHISEKNLFKEISEYFDIAYQMIENIYDSYEYTNFFEFEKICNLILDEMINIINEKNNTNFSNDMKKYEICIQESFVLVEKVLVDFF